MGKRPITSYLPWGSFKYFCKEGSSKLEKKLKAKFAYSALDHSEKIERKVNRRERLHLAYASLIPLTAITAILYFSIFPPGKSNRQETTNPQPTYRESTQTHQSTYDHLWNLADKNGDGDLNPDEQANYLQMKAAVEQKNK